MTRKRAKIARIPNSIKESKQVRITPEDPDKRSPLWSFQSVDIGGPWCWSALDGKKLVDVLAHLRDFETMDWNSIGRAGSHAISVAKIIPRACNRLQEIVSDDTDSLFSLRVSAAGRIWGIRVGYVIRLLWWDPKHEICPSPKKHT